MDSELAQENLIKIAMVSQEIGKVFADANARHDRVKGPDLSRAQFWLDKIKVTSGEILEALITNTTGSTPDERLKVWISANGPVICLMALNEMKKIIGIDRPEKSLFGHMSSTIGLSPVPADGKIHEAVRVLHDRRDYFDYFLTSGVWKQDSHAAHKPRVAPPVTVQLSVNSVVVQDTRYGRQGWIGVRNFGVEYTLLEEHKFQIDLEQLDIILRWLGAFRCTEKHGTTLSQRQADTCTWLPETNEYKTWLAGDHSFLWLHGKAGCGKSVLVASVIESLEKTVVDDPLAFFYCDFWKERSMDATEVMRSLLYQLVDQCRRRSVDPGVVQVIDELTEESRKGDAALRDIVRLSSLVSRVAERFHRPPLIVIDALDECKDVDRLLCALLGLTTIRMRLFMSSRPIQIIRYRFRKLPNISVDEMAGVSADIEFHVNREIDSHPRLRFLNPILKKKARSTLCQKADGMFRWVQCQLDTLKRCVTIREFHNTLNSLPIGLYATYERILLGINRRPSEAMLVQRALAWLVVASRPLALMEVVEALRIDPLSQTLDRDDAPIHGYALLEALGSLVVHDEEKTDTVNLSHFSVKEYLIGEPTRKMTAKYHINLRVAHKQVFLLCMYYLVASLNHPFDDDETPQSRPLLDYVFSCGFDHLAYLEPTDDAILGVLMTLRSEIQKHPLEWTHMCRMASLYYPYKTWITQEHDFVICVLVSMFPESFLHAFLRRAPRTAKYASNPLVHTLQFNKVEHAKILLSHGVDVNSVGWDIEGLQRDFKLPLEVALRRENDAFFDLFLKEGSAAIPRTIYSTIFDGHHCDYSPHFVSSLLQADEFAEWAAEVQDVGRLLRALDRERYREPQVTERDLLVMIRKLVQIWRDAPPLDSFAYILLMVAFASSCGHFTLLEYLISIDAPIPSGVMLSEGAAPFIHNLVQGLDAKEVSAKGDLALQKVLGRCTGGLRCWVLDCDLCSVLRSTLLITLGRASEKTLTEILMASRELVATLTTASIYYVDDLRIPRVLSCLQKIVLASGALLQAINESFLSSSTVDCDSEHWLSGKEPEACSDTLQQMLKFKWLSLRNELDGVITIFDEQKDHFDFLLAADVDKNGADSTISVPGVNHGGAEARDIERLLPLSGRSCLIEAQGGVLMAWSNISKSTIERDIIFVGQTGVGKSTLINMIMGVQACSTAAAEVSSDTTRPCTTHTTSYPALLPANLRCELWDTRGIDVSAGSQDSFLATFRLVDQITLASWCLPARGSRSTSPILVWCIDATKVDVPIYWDRFRTLYKDCRRQVIPVVVITRGPPKNPQWDERCMDHLRQLDLRIDVPFRMVRRYRGPSSPDYVDDSRALRDLISEIITRDNL